MVAFAKKLAAERPEEVALRDPERALSWADLDDALNRTANALLATDLGPRGLSCGIERSSVRSGNCQTSNVERPAVIRRSPEEVKRNA